MNSDDIRRYIRHAGALREANAADESGQHVSTDAQFRDWLGEHLVLAFGDLERGDHLLAFRSLLLCREYVGRLGGFAPSPPISDALLALRNAIEDHIQGAKR